MYVARREKEPGAGWWWWFEWLPSPGPHPHVGVTTIALDGWMHCEEHAWLVSLAYLAYQTLFLPFCKLLALPHGPFFCLLHDTPIAVDALL
jgi:hypothetical protein